MYHIRKTDAVREALGDWAEAIDAGALIEAARHAKTPLPGVIFNPTVYASSAGGSIGARGNSRWSFDRSMIGEFRSVVRDLVAEFGSPATRAFIGLEAPAKARPAQRMPKEEKTTQPPTSA